MHKEDSGGDRMKHLSLFSGIGGLDLAAEMAGFKTVGQVEIDDYCNRVLEHHWPDVPRWRDIRDVTKESVRKAGVGAITVISGGFPCQPFSQAGKRGGTEDDRYLWPEMLRVIDELRPAWVIAENVNGIVSMELEILSVAVEGRTIGRFKDYDFYRAVYTRQEVMLLGTICQELEAKGYEVQPLAIPACAVEAPHERRRVFIVAHSASAQCHAGAEVKRVLRGVPEDGQKHGYPDRSGETRNLADAESRQDNRREPGELAEKAEAGASCNPAVNPGSQDVAYTPQHLFNRLRQTRETGRGEFADGSNVADPDVMHREQCRSLGRMGREGEPDQGDGRGQGPTQSGMGRNFDGPPAGLAGYRWPAGPGPQHPWEPPRIATGVKDRVAKLKALGNAVVPAQAYPIFRAIMEIEVAGCMRVIVGRT